MSTEQALQPLVQEIPFSKETQNEFAENLIARVKEGEVDPIATYAKARAIIEVMNIFIKNPEVVSTTLNAIDKFGKGGTTYQGARIISSETGVRYDFTACGDAVWNDLSAQKAAIDAKMKERETFLRSLAQPITIVDDQTGEIATVCAPVKTSSTSVKITFAK